MQDCAACDNCLSPRQTFDGTLSAQKFLSCVYLIREQSGFGVGLNYVVDVLTGATTEKIRRWRHERLSTYGIGKEHTRQEWSAIGRELVGLGCLKQAAEKFSILELTAEGRAVLNEQKPVTLSRRLSPPPSPVCSGSSLTKAERGGQIHCDEALFERLRRLRKRLADERNVPAYIVFSDVSLRHMARDMPGDEQAFSRISGVGEKKLREFSAIFLSEITGYLEQAVLPT